MAQEMAHEQRCDLCGAEFPNGDLLRDHRDGTHGNRCSACGADFTTEALLANHQSAHSGTDAVLAAEQGELKP